MNFESRLEYLKRSKKVSSRKKPFYKKWWSFLLAILVYFVLIYFFAFAFLLFKIFFYPEFREQFILSSNILNTQKPAERTEFLEKRLAIVEGQNTPYIGSDNPEITIVVFSDFTCPYCKQAAEVIAALSVKYGQRVKIISREFPVLSENSVILANAVLCAHDQDRYWPMYYKLFEVQGEFSMNNLTSLARLSGVPNIDLFSDCLNNEKNYNSVVQSVTDGQFMELRGTPAWFINGEKVHEGFVPFSFFSEVLDKLLPAE